MKYSFFGNIKFIYGQLFSKYSLTKVVLPLGIILYVLVQIIEVALPAVVVYGIENFRGFYFFIGTLALIMIVKSIFKGLLIWSDKTQNNLQTYTRIYGFLTDSIDESLKTDYLNRESYENQKKVSKGINALSSNWVGIEMTYKQFPMVIKNAIGLFLYGSAILIVDIRILILLFVMTILNLILNGSARKYLENHREEDALIRKRTDYLFDNSRKIKTGKDIRAYKMENWFGSLFAEVIVKGTNWQKSIEKRFYLPVASDTIFLGLRDMVAYIILVVQVIDGKISISTMTLCIGIIASFSDWFFGLVNGINEIKISNRAISDYREMADMKNIFLREQGKNTKDIISSPEIEFKNVSFKYDGSDEYILKNFDLHINPGEKIALVGNNGAGKTTIVKLLSGFYHPVEGEILVNGISIEEYNIEEYYKIIGVVFQDIEPLNFTIRENIIGEKNDEISIEKMWKALEKSGLYNKIKSLKNGVDTYLSKEFETDGIQLSGGETQKLMLARAIFKNAPIMILDEPTSALDPIGESQLYEEYNELTDKKTSIFISHRLASTRFCNRIIYLENGMIKEEGTHDELIDMAGEYANIYNIQSHYYN